MKQSNRQGRIEQARARTPEQALGLRLARSPRMPHWVRESARLGIGARGQCVSCDSFTIVRDGLCAGCRQE
jgi:hypothetical protein